MGIATIMICASLVAVDGDTVRCDGQLLRDMGDGAPFVSGYDTPELRGPGACPESRELAIAARDRMAELLATEEITVENSGQVDTTRAKRPLVVLRRPDGSTIGAALLAEGLARPWPPDGSIVWCSS